MSACKNSCTEQQRKAHRHKGKSSESLLDKRLILSALNIQPGQRVLDAGCGNGYMTKEFIKIVGDKGKVFAIDPDEESIMTLTQELAETNAEAIVADVTKQTCIAENSIDLIYLSTVLHGFSKEQQRGFQDEVQRLLCSEGRLAIVEIVKEETPFGPPLEIRFSKEELAKLFALTPLTTIKVGEYLYMSVFQKKT